MRRHPALHTLIMGHAERASRRTVVDVVNTCVAAVNAQTTQIDVLSGSTKTLAMRVEALEAGQKALETSTKDAHVRLKAQGLIVTDIEQRLARHERTFVPAGDVRTLIESAVSDVRGRVSVADVKASTALLRPPALTFIGRMRWLFTGKA